MILSLGLVAICTGFAKGAYVENQQVLNYELDQFQTCPIDIPLTCTNTTPVQNSCCFESPGGIMLQTQFWDYYPPVGDNETFTLHGLWPDNCDGSYEQFCDDSLNLKQNEVVDIIKNQYKDEELIEFMKSNWKNFNGNDESLWTHEFNKHGTCIKTIRSKCFADYKENENVYKFFNISVNLFKKYPTFKFLNEEGIIPSNDQTYTKEEISNALKKNFDGKQVYFKCNKYNALQEIWYYHHLKGSLLNEDFVPIDSLINSNCPNQGIKFIPKNQGFKPPPNQPPKSPNRGYLKLSNNPGCLISNGQWYQYGTCATYQINQLAFGGYNIKSSKGYCGIDSNDRLNCNSQNQPLRYQFHFDKELKEISYGSINQWCFDDKGKHGHGKYVQVPIKLNKDNCESPFTIKLV